MNVGIDDSYIFRERRKAHGDAAIGVSDEATAVEDEFVVAADGVHVGDGATQSAGGIGDDFCADIPFAVVPRAGRKVDHEVALHRGKLGYGGRGRDKGGAC